ncbi:unnamed protein product [Dibothriocephalus latus]|uniref:Gelsolin-like domain-containing protein n=1 Tax=Dibothriocephalus latus TaxID=60516 RepID=A0A3P7MCC5_DIBLA|nr:unnamed protein product [Dibothriocephalus latus]
MIDSRIESEAFVEPAFVFCLPGNANPSWRVLNPALFPFLSDCVLVQHEFWTSLPDTDVSSVAERAQVVKALYKVSDESGKLEITLVSEGSAPKSEVKSDDVYMVQSKEGLFVYIGKDCSPVEKKNALATAHKHLQNSPTPFLPITVVTEDKAESFLKGIWD